METRTEHPRHLAIHCTSSTSKEPCCATSWILSVRLGYFLKAISPWSLKCQKANEHFMCIGKKRGRNNHALEAKIEASQTAQTVFWAYFLYHLYQHLDCPAFRHIVKWGGSLLLPSQRLGSRQTCSQSAALSPTSSSFCFGCRG